MPHGLAAQQKMRFTRPSRRQYGPSVADFYQFQMAGKERLAENLTLIPRVHDGTAASAKQAVLPSLQPSRVTSGCNQLKTLGTGAA